MSIAKRIIKKSEHKRQLQKDGTAEYSKKLVSLMLAAGFAASSLVHSVQAINVAEAAEGENGIVRVDGTNVTFENNVANIYAEEISAAGSVGLNRFTNFDVTNGQTANLFFQKTADGPTVNTLVNMVQNQINIAGTVNAVRNNQIGGHLYFLSPQGMVVGATGVINAGALTVMTPTEDFFKKAAYGVKTITTEVTGGETTTTKEFVTTDIWTADAAKVQNYLALQGAYLAQGKMAGIDENNEIVEASIPINGSGTIAVHGTMNASTAIALSAANIDVSKTEGAEKNPLLQTGVVFENTVNAGVFTTGAVKAGEKLVATADENGNIILTDPSNPTEDNKKNYISKTTTTEVSTVATTTEKTTVTKGAEAPKVTDKVTTVTETVSTSVAEFADKKGEDSTTEAVFSKETAKEYTKPDDTADTKYELSADKKTLTKTVTKTEDSVTTVTTTETSEKSKTSEAGKDTDTADKKSKPQEVVAYADVKDGNAISGDGSIALRATTDEINFKADDSSGLVKFASWFGVNADPSKISIKATLKELLGEKDLDDLTKKLLETPEDSASLQAVWKEFIARANDTKKAEVTVGAGATIQAVGNAEVSSTAVINQVLGEDDYADFSKQFAQTLAKTTVNGKVTGADVNISATAESSYLSAASAGLGSMLTENQKISNLKNILPDAIKDSKAGDVTASIIDLANEVNVALGLTNSKAKVTVGETAELKAEMLKVKDEKGNMKPFEYEKTNEDGTKETANVGGNININSTATTTTDIQFAIKPKVKEGESAGSGTDSVLLNGALILEQTGAEATIDITGKSTIVKTTDDKGADKYESKSSINSEGSTIIAANSTNSATAAAAIEGPEAGAATIPAHFNAAVGVVNQNNNAKITIKEAVTAPEGTPAEALATANSITSGGGLIISADTDTSTSSTFGVKSDGNQAVSTAVNVVNTDTKATVENKAKLAGALISVSANDLVSGFDINTSNSYGPEEESAFKKFGDKFMSTKFVKSTQEKIKKLLGDTQGAANQANDETTGTPPPPSTADSWNKYFDVGAAVVVVNASNQAKADMQTGSALTAVAGVNVSSDVTIVDKNIKTTSVLAVDMKDVIAGVSAAVAVEKMVNKADTIVGDGVQMVTLTGDVSATAGVSDRYNRLTFMNETLKGSWELVKSGWEKAIKKGVPDTVKKNWEAFKTKFEANIDALINFGPTDKAEDAAKKAQEAAEAFEKMKEGLTEELVPGLAATTLAIKSYTDAANWATMYTSASSRATQSSTVAKGMVTGTVGIQNLTDKAHVNIGQNAQLLSVVSADEAGKPLPQGTVKTTAETNSGNVLISGKWGLLPNTSTTSGGNVGIGGTVGIQHDNSNSEVIIKNGATLSGGEVDVAADNNVMNVSVAVGGANAGTVGVTGMTSYMGGSSKSIVQVDDDAVLAAARVYGMVDTEDGKSKVPGDQATGKINITANNQTILTSVAGEITRANAAAIGASAGVISYDVHSKALVANIEAIDTNGAVGAEWTANGVDTIANNKGVMNTLTVAGVSAGGASARSGEGSDVPSDERSGSDIQPRENPAGDSRRNLSDTSVNSDGIGTNNRPGDAPSTTPQQDDSSSNPDNGSGASDGSDNAADRNANNASKVNIAVAGSVSWNDINERTEAKLSQVTIGLTETSKAADYTGAVTENKKINVGATDSTFIGAYSGATALTKAGNSAGGSADGNEGSGGGFSASLSGAVAVNNIYKNSAAEISSATINNELEVNNKAENSGTQVAAGIALGIEQGNRKNSYGFNVDASGSFNYINSTVKAQLKDSTIDGSSTANVNLNNTAYDKDVQVAGGLSFNYTKSSAGMGAAIAVNRITNNIIADISGSTLGTDGKSLGAINNLAVSKLTQVGGAISLGVVPRGDSRNYVTANAAVAVNNVTNDLNSTGSNNTIYAKKLDVKASDGKLSTSEAANEYILQLQKEGFDVDEDASKMEAVKNASENKDIGVKTNPDGTLDTNKETVKEDGSDKSKETVKYTQTNAAVSSGGNIIVGSAMGLTFKTDRTSGASVGAAVALNKIDNDFRAKLSGGSVNITPAATEAATSIEVAANSKTLQVGVSAGVSVQASSGTVKGVAAAGSVSIQRASNDTIAAVENIDIKADSTSVTAENKSTQTTVAGLASVSTANAAAGMTWAQNNLNNTTGAYVNGITLDKFSSDAAKAASLKVDSQNISKTLAVGASVGTSIALKGDSSFDATANGAYAANKGINSTEAVIDKYQKDSTTKRNTISNAGNVSATANDESNLKGIAGNISVSAGKAKVGVSVGGSVVNNDIGTSGKKQKIRAEINEADITTAAKGTVQANATNNASILAVGAGGAVAGGTGKVEISAQGSVATSAIHTNTIAGMSNTNIDKGDSSKHNAVVNVNAVSNNKIISTADGLTVSAGPGTLKLGAAAAVSKVTSNADTKAEISGGEQNVKSELVKAASDAKITDVAAALSAGVGFGLVGASGTANVAINNINNNVTAKINNNAVVNAYDSLGVLAESSDTLRNYGGAVSVGVSAKAGVALGATVVVNKITGNTEASIDGSSVSAKGNGDSISVKEYEPSTETAGTDKELSSVGINEKTVDKKGLVVNADAKHTLNDISVTAGVGASTFAGVGINATVINNTIGGNTKAEITKTDVNKTLAGLTDNSNVSVQSNDRLDVSSHAGTLSVGAGAAGGVSAAAAVDVNNFNRTTVADITGKAAADRNTVNANATSVKALGSTNLLVTESGLSAGAGLKVGIGATGVVSKNNFTNNTAASMSNVDGQQNNVNIDADSVKLLRAYTNAAALSGGYVAVAASASVINTTDTSTTEARLADSKLEADKNKKASSKVNVEANNHAVLGSQSAGGALAIGFGGAAGVTVANNNLTNTVATYVTNAELGRSADAYKAFSAKSSNTFTDKFLNISVGGGIGGIGVGVANNTINSSALTNITGGDVYADGIDISAVENRTVNEQMVGVTVGGGAISTNVSTTTIGGALLDTYVDNTAKGDTASYSTDKIQTMSLQADQEAKNLNNQFVVIYTDDDGKYINDKLVDLTKDMFTEDKRTLTYDKGAKSQGVQTVLDGAVLKSSGNVNIESHATTNTNIEVDQAAVGIAAVGVAVLNTTVGTDSGVSVKGGNLQGQNVSIKSLSDGTLKQETTQMAAGGVGANVAISKITREGNNLITIGDNVNKTIIRAGLDNKSAAGTDAALTILAQNNTVLDNDGVTGSASVVGGTAQVIKAFDYSDNKVEIKGKADLASYNYIVENENIKWEPGRAGTIKDVDGNILYNITRSTVDGKDVVQIRDGAGKLIRTVEYIKAAAAGNPEKIVVKDAEGNIQNTAEYIKATTAGGKDETIFRDKDGNVISDKDAKGIQSPWDLTYTSKKLELGTVDVKVVNSNKINAELRGGGVSGVGGSGIVVLAEEGKRNSDGTLDKGFTSVNVEGANNFIGKDVTLASENRATAYAKEFGFGLSILSASVFKTTANLQGAVNTIVGDGQSFGAENLHLSAETIQPTASGKYSAEAHTQAIGTGGVNVAINHAYANTGIDTKLSVGNEIYKTAKWQETQTDDTTGYVKDASGNVVKDKDGNPLSEIIKTDITIEGDKLLEGGTALDLKAHSTASTKSNVTGINGSVISVGSNNAYTKNKNTVTLDFNPGTYKAGSLTLAAGVTDNVITTANGDGGSVVGVSPHAAHTVHENASATTINLSGSYELEGDMTVKATTGVVQDMLASAVQATIAGGSGTIGESTTSNTAIVNLADSTRINAGGKVDIGAFNKVDFNRNRDYAVKGNGFGVANMAVAKMTNNVTTNSQVNLGKAQIVSDGSQTYSAETVNNLKSQLYVLSAGVVAGAYGENTIDVTANDSVSQLSGGLLKVSGKGSDINIGAVDNQILNTRAMVENVGGAVAGSSAITNNKLNRTNTVNIDGKIFSRHDVKLFAGQGADGKLSRMELTSSAEAMTMGLIPVALPPQINNTFIQENKVNVNGTGDVQAIRNVYLYADAGKEITDLFSGRYTMYAGKGDSKYAATTNGQSNVEGRGGIEGKTADNAIKVNGSVLAGAGNIQTYTIGDPSMLVVTTKEQYDVIMAYYAAHPGVAKQNVVLVLSDADYAAQSGSLDASYNVKKLSEIIKMEDGAKDYSGLTPANFKLGTIGYAMSKLARLNELISLMSDNKDSDPTAYVGYKADYERIYSELEKEGMLDSKGNIIRDFTVNYVEIPDLAASGGNVIAVSKKFDGDGSVKAKGNPNITLTNNTTLATTINNITVYEPGGEIYYNGVSLDTKSDPKKLNGATVKTMEADKGTTSQINIYGKNSISEVNYRVNDPDLKDADKDQRIPVKADILIQGQVAAEGGKVTVHSQNDSIILEGKSAKDAAAVVGKEVSLTAKGSIQQSYKDDIENIGGDPQYQYAPYFNDYLNTRYKEGKSLNVGYNLPDSVKTSSKSRLSGDDIYINASDVNINGTIQSGYEKYFVNLSDGTLLDKDNKVVPAGTTGAITLEQRIAQITNTNGGKNVTDESVIGNPLYQVVSGSEVKNSKGYYDYMINVYYNPSGNNGKGKLLTENIDSKGGRVYITGRISSTGGGQIYCLDGTYNIDVNNTSKYLLQTGKLVVNDVAGQVKITDTNQNTITTITRNDDGTLNKNFEAIFKDQASAGSAVMPGTYYYRPQSGLRYNWTSGYYKAQLNTYRKSWYNARWGKGDPNEVMKEALIDAEKKTAPIAAAPASTETKRNGAYIGTVTSDLGPVDCDFNVLYTHKELVDARKEVERRNWKQGMYGCHHYTEVTWQTLKGTSNSFLASVRADNPVGIKFIGDYKADSTVNVKSDVGLIVGGDTGNRQLYEAGITDIARSEKGIVNLSSKAGSIDQIGGDLYGAKVNLGAKGSMTNISVSAGDTVELTAEKLGPTYYSSRDITVLVNSNKAAKGDVLVKGTFGSYDTDNILLATAGNSGNINTADKAVIYGSRIDLLSANGGINATVQAGQSFVGTDTLAASVNAIAAKDITLTQQSGDMRLGRVYSADGDVTLNTIGSFVDALPYAENKAGTEKELVEKWLKAGLISDSTASKDMQDASKEMQAEKVTTLNRISTDDYKADVAKSYARYETLKSKPEGERTEAEKDEFAGLNSTFSEYSSADDYLAKNSYSFADNYKAGLENGYKRYVELKDKSGRDEKEEKEFKVWQEVFNGYTGVDDFLAKNENAKKLTTDEAKTYQQWDKNAMLYSIQQSIINQTADSLPKTSSKDPNVKGNNITLNARDNAGLYSDTVTKMHVDNLGDSNVVDELSKKNGLENLKTLARADASTVTWDSTADNGRGVITITKKLPIGVQTNIAEGKLTVGKYEGGTLKNVDGNAFLEGRTIVGLAEPGNKDITIDAIRAVGNVSVTSMGSIINGAASNTAAITGKTLNISAVGSIGTNDKMLTTDLNGGSLRAVGYSTASGAGAPAGGIYINNVGNSNLLIDAVSTGGQLKLHAAKDILMADNKADIKGVIQTENDGDIELISREGSVGSKDKLLLIKNSTDGVDDKRKVTVGAKKNIYLEGVSTATDQKAAGGQLNLTLVDEGKAQGGDASLENVKVNVNGTLKLLDDVTAKENIELNSVETLTLDKNLTAKNITLQAGEVTTVQGNVSKNEAADLKLKGGNINAKATASLNAARDLLIENGNISAEAASLTAGRNLKQTYVISADGKTPESGSIIEAKKLTAVSTGNLDLGSGFNKLNNVILDNRSKEKDADNNPVNNSVILGNAGTHGLNVEVHNTLEGQDDTVHGTLSITKYGKAADETKVDEGMLLNGGKVTGDISVVNNEDYITNTGNFSVVGSGDITMQAKTDIYNRGDIAVKQDGNINMTADNDITNAGNIAISGKGDVAMTAGKNIVNLGDIGINGDGNINMTALEDVFNGGVAAGSTGKMEINGAGNIALEAKTGSVYNYKGADLLAHNGQITLQATNDKAYAVYYYNDQGGRVNVAPELLHTVVMDEYGCAMIDGKLRIIYIDGSVFNGGDIAALGDKAKIEMVAKVGDIYNYDDFNTVDDASGHQTGVMPNGTTISTGDVVMKANEGLVYNDKDIVSDSNVTIEAKKGLGSFGTSISAGKNITLTATDGDFVNKAKLVSSEGNITLEATKGTVVNMLDGDVLALGGSVTMTAGGAVNDIADGKRPIYTVDSTGDMKSIDVYTKDTTTGELKQGLEKDKMIVVDKYYLADGHSASTAVLIDDSVDTTALTKKQRDSIYGIISYVENKATGTEPEKPAAKRIALRDAKGDLLKVQGDIEVFRKGDVVNRGDVVALGKTIEQPDGSLKPDESNKGTISITSLHSNVSNYDNFAKVDGKEDYEYDGKKYLIAQGDISMSASEGYIYNTLNYIGNSNVKFDAKGNINIGTAETGGYAAGNLLVRSTEGRVVGTGNLIAGAGIVIDAAKGVAIDAADGTGVTSLTSDNGVIRIATKEGGISFGKEGAKITSGGSIDIGAEKGDIDLSKVQLSAGEMAAVGSKDGHVTVGEITGKEVLLYTDGKDKSVTANKINVEDHLLLRGDNIKTDNVNHTGEGWLHVDATGAKGEVIKSNIAMDISGDTYFSTLNATTANINVLNGGQLAIDKLHIADKGYFNAMDYLTAVYGRPVYNEGSESVYYDVGDGKGNDFTQDLQLEKMLFGAYGTDKDAGDTAPSYKKPVYVSEVREKLTQKGAAVGPFTKYNKGWMNLYIDSPNFQRSNGILLNINDYYYANHQRYAANDHFTMVADMKPANVYRFYYKDQLGLFDRYNLIGLPKVAAVQPINGPSSKKKRFIIVDPAAMSEGAEEKTLQ